MTSTKRLFSGSALTCIRGGRTVFKNLSFALDSGDLLHLSGANGVGKSSLLRIMSGALLTSAGEMIWEGRGYLEMGLESHLSRFSFLPSDDRNLKLRETVFENLSFWAAMTGAEDKACFQVLEKMQMLDLKDRPVRLLSAGQKRRVSLARVFLKSAPLWLLDEPLNGLDAASSALLFQAISAHCADGGMVVAASHYPLPAPAQGELKVLEMGSVS